jgi:glycine cleavage system H protein
VSIPTDRKYTRDHEWLLTDGATGRVGVTAYAADSLGDVVYVDLPDVGSQITAGEPCGEIESTKSVSDLVAPVSGQVTAVNADVVEAPESVSADPWSAWLYEVIFDDDSELITADEYREFVEGLDA